VPSTSWEELSFLKNIIPLSSQTVGFKIQPLFLLLLKFYTQYHSFAVENSSNDIVLYFYTLYQVQVCGFYQYIVVEHQLGTQLL
jgi:hypothetical protein